MSCAKRILQGGGDRIRYEDLEFELQDETETDEMRVIFLRSSDGSPCAVIHIHPTSKDLAVLQIFEYGSTCSFNRKMNRGEDTRKMLYAIRDYLKQQSIRRLQFTDASTYTCQDGTKVSLRMSYLLCYGKTWYDSVLPCEPIGKERIYRQAKQDILQLTWNTARSLLSPAIAIEKAILDYVPQQDVLFKDVVNYLRQDSKCSQYAEWLPALWRCLVIHTFEGDVFEAKL
jgi:hypothetical protein